MIRTKQTKKQSLIETYRPYLVPIVAGGLVVLIIILLLVQAAGMQITLSKLIDQSSKNSERIDAVVQSILIETKYTNELRAQMGLSKIEYPIQTLMQKETGEGDDSGRMIALFRAADAVYSTYATERGESLVDRTLAEPLLKEFLRTTHLIVQRQDELTLVFARNGFDYFTVTRNPGKNKFEIVPLIGDTFEAEEIEKTAIARLDALIPKIDAHAKQIGDALEKLKRIREDLNLAAILGERELEIAAGEASAVSYRYNLMHKKTILVEIGLDKKDGSFFIGDKKIKQFDDFIRELATTAKNADLRSDTDKMVERVQIEFQKSLLDKGFSTYLASRNMSVTMNPRPDYYFFYYDITVDGKKIGSFGIDRFHGDIYLMDPDDVQIGSLKAVMEGIDTDVKKN